MADGPWAGSMEAAVVHGNSGLKVSRGLFCVAARVDTGEGNLVDEGIFGKSRFKGEV